MLCIGVPAKAILTGTITFALPLLLGQHGYRQEDIGQIIMLYAISVVAASGSSPAWSIEPATRRPSCSGAPSISGGGLVLIGLWARQSSATGCSAPSWSSLGVVWVGLAHGFINAPVVTHVAHSELAKQIGANSVTTTYRFVERIGHVAGPVLIAQMFLIWGQSPQILIGIGIAVAILGFLFLIKTLHPA